MTRFTGSGVTVVSASEEDGVVAVFCRLEGPGSAICLGGGLGCGTGITFKLDGGPERYDDWPVGRGIFFNAEKTFITWVNEEDHLRFISMQKGGDLGAVYKRLVTAVKDLEENMSFAHSERLGYLAFCPSNLGTGIRASVIASQEVS